MRIYSQNLIDVFESIFTMIDVGASECRVKHELYNILDYKVPGVLLESFSEYVHHMQKSVEEEYIAHHRDSDKWFYETLITLESYIEDVEEDYYY